MRGRKIDTSASDSDIFIQIPSLMKHTQSSKVKSIKRETNPTKPKQSKSKPKSSSKDLKNEEVKLTKKMKDYEKQISSLRNQLQDDQSNQKYIETINQTQAEYDKLIQSYEETIQNFKKNEINLLEELQAQSTIAKDALNKLYQFQQENNIERDKLKQYYEDYYHDKEQELQRKFDLQMQQLQNQFKESNITIDQELLHNKLRDLANKEQIYLEQIETLKIKLSTKHQGSKEKELRQKLLDVELKLQEWEENIEKLKYLESENQRLLLKVNQYEKKLIRKEEKEKKLKGEWNRQYSDLQSEIKYWKSEMDKVIMENNLVLSRLTPKKKY